MPICRMWRHLGGAGFVLIPFRKLVTVGCREPRPTETTRFVQFSARHQSISLVSTFLTYHQALHHGVSRLTGLGLCQLTLQIVRDFISAVIHPYAGRWRADIAQRALLGSMCWGRMSPGRNRDWKQRRLEAHRVVAHLSTGQSPPPHGNTSSVSGISPHSDSLLGEIMTCKDTTDQP
jgi:hypothetical protein